MSSAVSSGSLPPHPAGAGGSKRERRRDSFDALGRAVLNTQQHQLQQQAAHLQQMPHPLHGGFSPALSPSPASSLPASPTRSSLPPVAARHPALFTHHTTSASSHPHGHSHAHVHHSASSSSALPAPLSVGGHEYHVQPVSEFPFPSLLTLNRSRLLYLLEYQCRISEQTNSSGAPVDVDSAQHFRTLVAAVRSLHLAGGVSNFSFVHASSVASDLLGGLKNVPGNSARALSSPLSAVQLLDLLHGIRTSSSPSLAHPAELPPALLDSGIYYVPDVEDPSALELSPFVYHRVLALLSLLLNLHIHRMTLTRILTLLQGIDVHLDYWMSHQALTSLPKPYRLWKYVQYKLGRTAKSFSRSSATTAAAASPRRRQAQDAAAASSNPYHQWSQVAARNVRELVDLKKRWTTRCGRIAVRMHRMQEWLIASFGKAASTRAPAPDDAAIFHAQIERTEVYFSKIYRYIVQADLRAHTRQDVADAARQMHFTPPHSSRRVQSPASDTSPASASPSAGAHSIQQKIYALYSQFAHYEHYLLALETQFVHAFEEEVRARRKPHHLFEWWHYYTGAALLVGCGAVYAFRNQSEVRDAVNTAIQSSRFFCNEHLWEPLANIYETTFKTFHDRSLFSTNERTLVQSKEDLSAMLSDFAHNHVSELSAHEQRQKQEYVESIDRRAREGDMDLVMKPYNREIQHPIRSLLIGDLMRGLLIQVQKVKVDTEAAMLAMDQILKANKINFNLLATIPFLMMGYATFDFSNKWILRGTWSSKKVRDRVRQCKRILSELEQIYVLHVQLAPAAASSSASTLARLMRPALHTAYQTLTVDEFAAIGSQEQEEEDEALRLAAAKESATLAFIGTEVFGPLDKATGSAAEQDSEDEEGEEQEASPTASHVSVPVSRSVLGLSNHAYGRTLSLILSLSTHLAQLPLTSSFASSHRIASAGSAQDPRLILHKDCVLLASDQLSPEQKYLWVAHMWRAWSFLAAP